LLLEFFNLAIYNTILSEAKYQVYKIITGTPTLEGAEASAESPSLSTLDLAMDEVLPPLLGGILSRTFLRFTYKMKIIKM